jgi:hypothetical protein
MIPTSAAASHGTATFGSSPFGFSGGGHQFRRRRLARRQGRRQRIAARQRRRHGQCRSRPLLGVRLEAAVDHALHGRVQILHQRGDAGRFCPFLHFHQLHQRGRLESALSREQLVQQQPQRVDVAPDGDFCPRKLLGRHVRRRTAADVALQLPAETRQPKIHDKDLAAAIDHDVGRLQVAVQHAFFVRRRQARAQLARGLQRLIHRQPPDTPQQGTEILPVHVLHGDVVQPLHLADVVNPAHVGMRHLARDAHFIIEARQRAFVASGGFRQELQRHHLSQRQVRGAIDLTHAAPPQQPGDAVAPRQHGARHEASFVYAARGTHAGRRRRRQHLRFRRRGVERRRAPGTEPAVIRALARAGRTIPHVSRPILARLAVNCRWPSRMLGHASGLSREHF